MGSALIPVSPQLPEPVPGRFQPRGRAVHSSKAVHWGFIASFLSPVLQYLGSQTELGFQVGLISAGMGDPGGFSVLSKLQP